MAERRAAKSDQKSDQKHTKNGHGKASVASIETDTEAMTSAKGARDAALPIDISLLKQLSETPGTSGREERVRALVLEQLRPLVDEVSVDALGNVIAIKKGSQDTRVMLAAHMDEIGFMVRHIDDKGMIRIQPTGGFDPRVLEAQRVLVHGSAGVTLRGALMPAGKQFAIFAQDKTTAPKLEDLYVDVGLPADQVNALVSLGDSITLDRELERVGEHVVGKAMDDRAGVFTMIEALRRLERNKATIVAVATVQEEVGLRGATTAAYHVHPDVAIALDVTSAFDVPGIPDNEAVAHLGRGAAIKVFDGSQIPNYKLVAHLRRIAEEHNIPHQLEVLPHGGTDAGAMQRARSGAAAITISIPTRYVHTVNEMVHPADLDAAASLLARYLEEAHSGDYTL